MMTKEQFIKQIAPLVQKYAPQFGISVCSPIIAQSILESNGGSSELAVNANNFFGLKYRAGRCPSACGIYNKVGSEQNTDGTYSSSAMKWMKFANMDMGVKGYFEFINISTYKNLKGVSDPETYLKNIKADGYATSLKYVDNLMNVIKTYNLTQYDTLNTETSKGGDKMIFNVHAGHNPDGKTACGAVGLIKESTEARKVKDKVIELLKKEGHTVYDCTVDNGTSQNDVLSKIVTKCNAHKVDLDISIHFNSGRNDYKGDGSTGGTEVFVYNTSSSAKDEADRICKKIASLGFRNRGVKYSTGLYFLRKSASPAMLIECCFVDDVDDVKLYNTDKMAKAIVEGILNKTVSTTASSTTTTTTTTSTSGIVIPAMSIIKGNTTNFGQIVKNIKTALNADYGLAFTINSTIDNILLINLGNVILSTVSYKPNTTYALQQLLKWWGYSLTVDGIFGNGTKTVITTFQKQTGITVTGTTTKEFWTKILGK